MFLAIIRKETTNGQIHVQTQGNQGRNERMQKERTSGKGKKCKQKEEKATEDKN